jgi:hypothetical protein
VSGLKDYYREKEPAKASVFARKLFFLHTEDGFRGGFIAYRMFRVGYYIIPSTYMLPGKVCGDGIP